jgi:hypothetical protein
MDKSGRDEKCFCAATSDPIGHLLPGGSPNPLNCGSLVPRYTKEYGHLREVRVRNESPLFKIHHCITAGRLYSMALPIHEGDMKATTTVSGTLFPIWIVQTFSSDSAIFRETNP